MDKERGLVSVHQSRGFRIARLVKSCQFANARVQEKFLARPQCGDPANLDEIRIRHGPTDKIQSFDFRIFH